MPPRKSERVTEKSKIDLSKHEKLLEVDLQGNANLSNTSTSLKTSTEYFEFQDADLKMEPSIKESEKQSSESDSVQLSAHPNSTKKRIEQIFSRKLKLLIRKVYLMCEIKSGQFFVKNQMKNQYLVAMTLSGLPPHILRIFDPVLVAEGKTLKNSVAMLATWWKNNIGSRMLPTNPKLQLSGARKNKILELKLAFFTKNAYEDDSVKLFALVCHGLGVNVRFVHSLDMLPATGVQKDNGSPSKFQYCPRFWVEFYSAFDERWISVDCIRGLVDERNRLENKTKPHSFVISIDSTECIQDLTEKYATDYLEKSFRLRKDEDKWLKELILRLNSEKVHMKSSLTDLDQISAKEELEKSIEIPKTLSAMKNHPKLMLESQLRKYEVFYPVKKAVGRFKDESVFLREHVKKVRSKDAWLSQCARIVKVKLNIILLNYYLTNI